MGRATVLSDSVAESYLGALRAGKTKKEAAEATSVGLWVFKRREAADSAFAREVRAAKREGTKARQRQAKAELREDRTVTADLQRKVDRALRDFMSYAQAARALGVSREAVRQMARKGTLPQVTTPAGPLVWLPKARRSVA